MAISHQLVYANPANAAFTGSTSYTLGSSFTTTVGRTYIILGDANTNAYQPPSGAGGVPTWTKISSVPMSGKYMWYGVCNTATTGFTFTGFSTSTTWYPSIVIDEFAGLSTTAPLISTPVYSGNWADSSSPQTFTLSVTYNNSKDALYIAAGYGADSGAFAGGGGATFSGKGYNSTTDGSVIASLYTTTNSASPTITLTTGLTGSTIYATAYELVAASGSQKTITFTAGETSTITPKPNRKSKLVATTAEHATMSILAGKQKVIGGTTIGDTSALTAALGKGKMTGFNVHDTSGVSVLKLSKGKTIGVALSEHAALTANVLQFGATPATSPNVTFTNVAHGRTTITSGTKCEIYSGTVNAHYLYMVTVRQEGTAPSGGAIPSGLSVGGGLTPVLLKSFNAANTANNANPDTYIYYIQPSSGTSVDIHYNSTVAATSGAPITFDYVVDVISSVSTSSTPVALSLVQQWNRNGSSATYLLNNAVASGNAGYAVTFANATSGSDVMTVTMNNYTQVSSTQMNALSGYLQSWGDQTPNGAQVTFASSSGTTSDLFTSVSFEVVSKPAQTYIGMILGEKSSASAKPTRKRVGVVNAVAEHSALVEKVARTRPIQDVVSEHATVTTANHRVRTDGFLVTDHSTITDTIDRKRTESVSIAEHSAVTETVGRGRTVQEHIAETSNVANFNSIRIRNDGANVNEHMVSSLAVGRNLVASSNVHASSSDIIAVGRNRTDGFVFGDTSHMHFTAGRMVVVAGEVIAESSSLVSGMARDRGETFNVQDAMTSSLVLGRGITLTIPLVEVVDAQVATGRNRTNGGSLVANTSNIYVMGGRLYALGTHIAEGSSAVADVIRERGMKSPITEQLHAQFTFNRTRLEQGFKVQESSDFWVDDGYTWRIGVRMANQSSLSFTLDRDRGFLVPIQEHSSASTKVGRARQDGVGITEHSGMQGKPNRRTATGANVHDNMNLNLVYGRKRRDSVHITETGSNTATVGRTRTDKFSIIEHNAVMVHPNRITGMVTTISEVSSITELLSAIRSMGAAILETSDITIPMLHTGKRIDMTVEENSDWEGSTIRIRDDFTNIAVQVDESVSVNRVLTAIATVNQAVEIDVALSRIMVNGFAIGEHSPIVIDLTNHRLPTQYQVIFEEDQYVAVDDETFKKKTVKSTYVLTTIDSFSIQLMPQ